MYEEGEEFFFQFEKESRQGKTYVLISITEWVIMDRMAPGLFHVHNKRDSGHNLEQGKFQLDIRKMCFVLFCIDVRMFRLGTRSQRGC